MNEHKDTKETPKPVEVKTPPVKVEAHVVAPPKPVLNTVPDGAIDINEVEPGFGPLQGSPKEGDSSQLANPNNPLSPITVPSNPSNPANPPNTQSDKPASEVRIFNALNPPPPVQLSAEAQKVADDRKAELKTLLADIGKAINEFGGESSIPPSHAYWGMVARHRVLSNP
jgi:hypothetical protein